MTDEKIQLTRFMAGEIQAITGRSLDNQRNDSRLGFDQDSIIIGNKRTRTVLGVAKALLIEAAADFGIGPTSINSHADLMKKHVAWWALSQPGAIWDQTDVFISDCKALEIDPASVVLSSTEGCGKRYGIIGRDRNVVFTDHLDGGQIDSGGVVFDLEELGKTVAANADRSLAVIIYQLAEEDKERLGRLIDEPPAWAKSE